MSERVKTAEQVVSELDPNELRQFSAWFAEFEHQIWDREIEEDSKTGRLDFLLDEAAQDRAQGTLRDICLPTKHRATS